MSLWYGLLYVVAEGWTFFGFVDPRIDELLKSENLLKLKDIRNANFHPQNEYWHRKHTDLITEGEAPVAWVTNLHAAFSEFFLKKFKDADGSG
jgi:hypothetical protein